MAKNSQEHFNYSRIELPAGRVCSQFTDQWVASHQTGWSLGRDSGESDHPKLVQTARGNTNVDSSALRRSNQSVI
ncbi:hypothetical protein, partial [Mesorhizobium sp. M4A.F.Ca.ET.050.02.1.1]|uniref:hypothetical protein n=1 Tax=Mesorhizobium sp. M4A.F.Ca.ET.050.02.1.1 TaxID=2496754 RepID=UPI001AECD774